MDIKNYSELGTEERIKAQTDLRTRIEYLYTSLYSAGQDTALDIEDKFFLPIGSSTVHVMFNGYDKSRIPQVIANVTVELEDSNWLPMIVGKELSIVKEDKLDLVLSVNMRYVDHVVNVSATVDAGLSDEMAQEINSELFRDMEFIGRHAQRSAQSAIELYFSEQETHRYLMNNDFKCYLDGRIAEDFGSLKGGSYD